MIKHQDMIQDQMTIQIEIVVEVHLEITIRKITTLNIEKDLHLELTRNTTPYTTLDHVMIIIKEILAHIVPQTDLLIDHPTNVIHVPVTNLDLTPEKITSKNTLLHIDLLQDLEIPDILESIIFNHNLLLIQLPLKYTCITQRKWQTH